MFFFPLSQFQFILLLFEPLLGTGMAKFSVFSSNINVKTDMYIYIYIHTVSEGKHFDLSSRPNMFSFCLFILFLGGSYFKCLVSRDFQDTHTHMISAFSSFRLHWNMFKVIFCSGFFGFHVGVFKASSYACMHTSSRLSSAKGPLCTPPVSMVVVVVAVFFIVDDIFGS